MDGLINEYEMVVGVFLPLLISIFIKEEWSDKLKIGVSFLFVLFASIGNVFYAGDWNAADFGKTILKILVLTVTTYKGFWSATGATDWLKKNAGLTSKSNGTVVKMIVGFLLVPMLMFGSMQMSACASLQVGGEKAEPWTSAYKNWTPYQKADFFMQMWLAQEADYNAMNAYPNKTEAMIKTLKAKREILEQSRMPLRTYASIVKGGGVPDAAMEQQIVSWLTQLQMTMLQGG